MNPEFRPCILAVFSNSEGKVLVAERAQPRGAWQFPQGGIDAGETAEVAARREMREELGCDEFEILARLDDAIRYHFPPDVKTPIAKKFRGQDQVWFHLRFREGASPNLERATDQEFVALEWVSPAEAMRRIVSFKRESYRAGLRALGFDIGE